MEYTWGQVFIVSKFHEGKEINTQVSLEVDLMSYVH